MKHRWQLPSRDTAAIEALCHSLPISDLVAQCLINRGYAEPAAAENFLQPRLKNLADPFLLPNMDTAVKRLLRARERDELVVIFGDYDVDGVTSTAILLDVMPRLGWRVESYLPNRMDEGYGLGRDALENCLQRHSVGVLLAIDCGTTSVDSIAWLNEQGVDTLVFDHHQMKEKWPEACAIVNAQLGDRFRELCSAGLAFKLAHALVKRGREEQEPAALAYDVRSLLDLVALGTIADMVELRDENRILVTAGLPRLTATRRPGLIALKEVAQCDRDIGSHQVGFQLGPRLNAAGRLETATAALDLLVESDLAAARKKAADLDAQNTERRAIERRIVDHIIGDLRAKFDPDRDFAIVLSDEDWHIGVVGIVASRVSKEFYRPTVIVGREGERWRGSGRSVEGFDLAAGLRECDDLLLTHGGHTMAAGMSLDPAQVTAFRERLNDIVKRELTPEQLIPPLRLDAEVTLEQVSLGTIDALGRLRPFGTGNASVQLVVKGLQIAGRPRTIGKEENHLRFSVRSRGVFANAIWWNGADKPLPQGNFDLACVPEINEYRGERSVQLKVLDWRAA